MACEVGVLHINLCSAVAVIDQGSGGNGAQAASGVLVLYDDNPRSAALQHSLELITNMNKVVDGLYTKAKKITA